MNIDLYCTELCKLSYSNNRKNSLFISNVNTDSQCYIDFSGINAFITFRGTTSLDDWKHDADTRTVNPQDNIRIHKGFYDQYMSVKNKIYRAIRNIRTDNIYISGHSLGGALAYVCAVDIHLATKNPNINVLTIGSPRPGNKDFANYFNKNIKHSVRYKNKGDIITKMPLRSKFNHVHSSICLENGTQQNDKVYNAFVSRFLSTLCTCATNIGDLRDNHSVDLYIDNIKKFNT
jgi:predicted lipase